MRTWSSHRVLLIVLCATIAFLAASLWSTEVAQAAARNPKGVAVIVGNKPTTEHRDIPAVLVRAPRRGRLPSLRRGRVGLRAQEHHRPSRRDTRAVSPYLRAQEG